jgi:hypothetical protein
LTHRPGKPEPRTSATPSQDWGKKK